MPQVKIQEDVQYGLTHKVGSIELDYGVRGEELKRELSQAGDKFVRDMELRGLTLYRPPGGYLAVPQTDGSTKIMSNPYWIENPDGEYANWYAIDWLNERPRKEQRTGGEYNVARDRETSLEDSQGMLEYRIIGIFWAPERSIEMLTSIAERKEREQAAKNPHSYIVDTPFGQ